MIYFTRQQYCCRDNYIYQVWLLGISWHLPYFKSTFAKNIIIYTDIEWTTTVKGKFEKSFCGTMYHVKYRYGFDCFFALFGYVIVCGGVISFIHLYCMLLHHDWASLWLPWYGKADLLQHGHTVPYTTTKHSWRTQTKYHHPYPAGSCG